MRRRAPLVVALVALVAVSTFATGCQQALVCDVSVFAVRTGEIAPGDALPPDSELILNAGDFDASKASIGPTDQGTEVQLQLKPAGAQRFRDYTAANVGRFIAVSLNGNVVSVPVIQSEIPDGSLSLTLPPTAQEENDAFASCIARRALPAVS